MPTTQRTLVIAEAGVNHNGDMGLAKRLVDTAVDAGADLVKFQTFCADRLVTQSAAKAEYQTKSTPATETQHAMLRRLELDRDMHEELIAHCSLRGIGFFSTGFDIESVNLLIELGQQLFKIPSGEITNLPYLRHIGRLGKEVIVSTGMAELAEVEATIGALEAAGTSRRQITLLHCTTEYPATVQEVNLQAMLTLRDTFGVRVGYSDHTVGIEIAIAAVALGATVIEKHFTLDRTMSGPDHLASLEPSELATMIKSIRNIEQAMGDGIKRPTNAELKNRPVARKSIVASRTIKAGDVFTEENVVAKRPGSGISPMQWDEVIGRRAVRDFSADEPISL